MFRSPLLNFFLATRPSTSALRAFAQDDTVSALRAFAQDDTDSALRAFGVRERGGLRLDVRGKLTRR
jgi:hypothetical protein